MSRVREVMERLTSSRSGLNPSSSYSRMGTGVAPENLIIDSYIGNPGIRVNDLVTFFQPGRSEQEVHNRLGARRDDNGVGRNVDAPGLGGVLSNRGPDVRESGSGSVVSESAV